MNKEDNNKDEISTNISLVLDEIKIILNHPYKDLIYDIEKKLKTNTVYHIQFYKFKEEFELEIKINKFRSNDLILFCLVTNSFFYKDVNAEPDFSNILTYHQVYKKHLIFTIANTIEFIQKIKDDYVYCKFNDRLIPKTKFNKELKINLQKHQLCNREIEECLVCYDAVSEFLKCSRCKKHICRDCEFKLKQPTCPNCRHTYILDEEYEEEY